MAALQPQALLVVTDTTQGMEFGIDAHVWTLGAKFEGLHSISEGPHLLPGGLRLPPPRAQGLAARRAALLLEPTCSTRKPRFTG